MSGKPHLRIAAVLGCFALFALATTSRARADILDDAIDAGVADLLSHGGLALV